MPSSAVFAWWLIGIILLGILIYIAPYRMDRFTVFLKPGADQTGIGWHLKQSLISFGSGGVFGKGFGMSVQKFKYLPEPIGDSVFAVFGEEFGSNYGRSGLKAVWYHYDKAHKGNFLNHVGHER